MDFQRMILFFALAFVTMMLWTEWNQFSNPQPPAPTAPVAGQAAGTPAAPGVPAPADAVPGAPAATPTAPAAGVTPAAPAAPATPGVAQTATGQSAATGETVTIRTDLFVAEINTLGGDLVTLDLLKHAESSTDLDTPFALLKTEQTEDGLDVFITQTGLIGRDSFGATAPNHTRVYATAQREYTIDSGQDSIQVPLTYDGGDGVVYTKTFTFHRGNYDIDLDYAVANNATLPWQGHLYAQFQRTSLSSDGGFGLMQAAPSFKGGAIYTKEEKYEKISFDDMTEDPLAKRTVDGWIGMLQHYFVGAWRPATAVPTEFYSKVIPNAVSPRYNFGFKHVEPLVVAPGAIGNVSTRLFVGPKERAHLSKFAEGLELSVDYGILTPISEPLFWVLNKIHSVVKNWGWAIILLTVLIKLVFFPLSAASYKSMARMKKMQPRLQTLKERYGDDRAKLNQEMMTLYKEEKINPLGGCLPILIQIPVFISLYWVLLESVELRQAPWAFWIQDLSIKDPYFVLPLLMGASMLAQQFLNPAPLDPIQKNIMMALPVVFTFMFLWFPAGLVLYWLVNNCLSIAQQWYITRKIV